MKKIVFLSLLLMSLGFGVYAQSEEEEIKNVIISMWEAIERGDIEAYSKYIHRDFTAFGENDPYLAEGKALEIEGIRSWIARSENIHTDMHQPKVTVKGSTAWITYYWTDYGLTNGSRFSTRGKSTRIFVKEKGNWLCIHGHYTAVP